MEHLCEAQMILKKQGEYLKNGKTKILAAWEIIIDAEIGFKV